jgi:hypothetical protein
LFDFALFTTIFHLLIDLNHVMPGIIVTLESMVNEFQYVSAKLPESNAIQ